MDDAHRETDERLADRIRVAHARGDAAAVQRDFLVLQSRYQERTRKHVDAKMDPSRVEDMVQEVFIALFDAIAGGGPILNLSAWLRRVTANHIADHYRGKEGGVTFTSFDEPENPPPHPREAGPEDYVVYMDVVERVLATLTDAHARVVELNLLEGRPADEVSRLTGESAANVYQIVRRFRVALLAALNGDHPTGDEN